VVTGLDFIYELITSFNLWVANYYSIRAVPPFYLNQYYFVWKLELRDDGSAKPS